MTTKVKNKNEETKGGKGRRGASNATNNWLILGSIKYSLKLVKPILMVTI